MYTVRHEKTHCHSVLHNVSVNRSANHNNSSLPPSSPPCHSPAPSWDSLDEQNAELGLISPKMLHIECAASPRGQSPLPTITPILKSNDATTALRRAILTTHNWVASLGPISQWPRIFQEQYDAACLSNGVSAQATVDQFLRGVERHVQTGRQIIQALMESGACCPPGSDEEAYADWIVAGNLLSTLHEGVAVLEVRLDIFAPQSPDSSTVSGIRQWRGLDGNF